VESLLKKKSRNVALNDLYLDPNNPRLAREEQPGYADPKVLFDAKLQSDLQEAVLKIYKVAELELAIESQGWLPIDSIVVWEHPKAAGKFLVVEGNTRLVALRRLRARLESERKRLEKMNAGKSRFAAHDVSNQEKIVATLAQIVSDTDELNVQELNAADVAELEQKLPRVLAVRHITGAKEWGNYAQDIWLLNRYETLFRKKHGSSAVMVWEQNLIDSIAHEAAISSVKARRQLIGASCFSHFKAGFDDQLPKGESFSREDYYLFENLVKKPWLRELFGLTADAVHVPKEREDVIFKWVFLKPRGNTADENPNVFYRHENILVLDQMHRYDQTHGTGFAAQFDPDDPDNAPRVGEVEAAWLVHKESRQPAAVIEQLLSQLSKLDSKTLINEGTFLRKQLQELSTYTNKVLSMIDAGQGDGRG
jgi:hypothetical protein